jgi:hypothetical protein
MVTAGILLAIFGAGWWFLVLAAAGTVGPGFLRELGWLQDQDEFQRRAAHTAGYHAFLVTLFVAFVTIAYTRSGHRHLQAAEELSVLYLSLLWFTWLFSSLVNYWGARRTAFRVLLIFGSAVGLFTVASNLADPVAMAMQLLGTTLPFFLFAALSLRWPRAAGALMVAASAGAGWYYFACLPRPALVVKAGTAIMILGPLLASGLALLPRRREDATAESA